MPVSEGKVSNLNFSSLGTMSSLSGVNLGTTLDMVCIPLIGSSESLDALQYQAIAQLCFACAKSGRRTRHGQKALRPGLEPQTAAI